MQRSYTHGSAVGEGVDGVRCLGGRAAFVFTLDIIEAVVINVGCVKSYATQCCASVSCVSLCLLLQTPVSCP